jgi:hypothetical protein
LAPFPLTSLSEAQRAQAQERFTIIRPALEKEITQAEVARTKPHHDLVDIYDSYLLDENR